MDSQARKRQSSTDGPVTAAELWRPRDEYAGHVSAGEAAHALGVSRKTLLRRLREETVPELRAFRLLGRWRVPVRKVTQMLEDAIKESQR